MKTSEKLTETKNKLSAKYKTKILNFLREYYFLPYKKPEFFYLSQVTRHWKVLFVRRATEILFNGLLIWFSVGWILALYLISQGYKIDFWFTMVIMIISFGFFSYLIRESYKYFRKGWRE